MKTSDEGIRLNKSFEGYHTKLANGDCTAYQTYLGKSRLTGKPLYDIPTCGYGTTKGVKMGMVWTQEYATQRMMEDLAEAESYVTRYVTVPINANQFDALVLFTNNCGPENLKKLIVPLNKGDASGTAKKFPLYNKAQGKVLDGLVSRRAREQALFLKPVEAPAAPYMPQTVEKSAEPPSGKTVAIAATASTATVAQFMPSVSDLDKIVSTGQRVRSLTDQAGDLGSWLMHSAATPWAMLVILAGVYFIWKSAGAGTSRSITNDSSN